MYMEKHCTHVRTCGRRSRQRQQQSITFPTRLLSKTRCTPQDDSANNKLPNSSNISQEEQDNLVTKRRKPPHNTPPGKPLPSLSRPLSLLLPPLPPPTTPPAPPSRYALSPPCPPVKNPSCGGLACFLSINIGFLPSRSSCLNNISGFSSSPKQRSWSP